VFIAAGVAIGMGAGALVSGPSGLMPRVVSLSIPVGFSSLISCAAEGLLCATAAPAVTVPSTAAANNVEKFLVALVIMAIPPPENHFSV
jgi:hypothetical protein